MCKPARHGAGGKHRFPIGHAGIAAKRKADSPLSQFDRNRLPAWPPGKARPAEAQLQETPELTMTDHAQHLPNDQPVQTLLVLAASDFRVTAGACLGDPVADASELVHDDVYGLTPGAPRRRISFRTEGDRFCIAPGSEAGRPGAALYLDCVITLMPPTGSTIEALLLAEVIGGELADIHVLPLAEIVPKQDYALVGIDRDAARDRFAALGCVSFTAGTHITLATGLQCPVEKLRVGDKVLTRDSGAQPIRWIGRQTTRATGAFAPIRIAEGVLNNAHDLIVSPNHRLFIYQRTDALALGRAEALVRAADLVNGTDVVQMPGGFVEYYQILFDNHEIIYAEGIAAESLLVDTRSETAVPPEVRRRLRDHAKRPHLSYEVPSDRLSESAAAALKKASLA